LKKDRKKLSKKLSKPFGYPESLQKAGINSIFAVKTLKTIEKLPSKKHRK
jgi:hypothetical protein